MNSDNNARPRSLSPSGEKSLNEYLQFRRDRIISEATRLGSEVSLDQFDIINAIGNLEARERLEHPVVHAVNRRSQMALITGSAILMTILIAFSIFSLSQSWNFNAEVPTVLAAIITGASIAAALSAALSAALLMRKQRRENESLQRYMRALEFDKYRKNSEKPKSGNLSDLYLIDYLKEWISLESKIRELGIEMDLISSRDSKKYPIGQLLRLLLTEKQIDGVLYEEIREAMRVRNSIVHGEINSLDRDSLQRLETINRYLTVL